MKKRIAAVITLMFATILVAATITSTLFSDTKYSRVENVVYYKNPQGKIGLYLSFELEINHRYQFQFTRNGVDFFDAFIEDTTGRINETYESFNIPDPGNGLWPRIIDLGATQ